MNLRVETDTVGFLVVHFRERDRDPQKEISKLLVEEYFFAPEVVEEFCREELEYDMSLLSAVDELSAREGFEETYSYHSHSRSTPDGHSYGPFTISEKTTTEGLCAGLEIPRGNPSWNPPSLPSVCLTFSGILLTRLGFWGIKKGRRRVYSMDNGSFLGGLWAFGFSLVFKVESEIRITG